MFSRTWAAGGRRLVAALSRRLALIVFLVFGGREVAAQACRPDRIIVQLVDHAPRNGLDDFHQRFGGKVLRALETPRQTQVIKLPPGQDIPEALAAYRSHGLVASAEPDYLLQSLATPNDFHYADQWNLRNTGMYGGTPGADVHAGAAWDLQHDAGSIIVAVVDSGVRYTHEDLAPNMWVNPGESGLDANGRDKRSNGIDDDGDGYIDDVHGINVLNGTGNPDDDWGHGTHVAGIVGAVGNNTVGVAGVAWRVQIMACKFIDAAANYSVSDAITCLDYARRHGARIVTASWGGYAFDSPALRDAISQLRAAGIIVTAAAGNDNNNNDLHPLYPASYDFDNVIAVAATNRTDDRAAYSNYGANAVDLGAPGSPVFSTWAGSDHDYRYNEGTSMAAAHLAGAAALLWARYPSETHQQIIQRILSTVDVLPALAGRTKSGGRLNLAAALASGSPPSGPPRPTLLSAPSNLSATAVSPTQVDLAWTDNTTLESGYEIQRSTDNASFVPAGSAGADATRASVTALAGSTTYYFRVRAFQGGTTSAWSNTISATTPAAPPPSAGSGWLDADVGAVAAAGSSSGTGSSQTVAGSGADIWDRADEFHFRYQSFNGDGAFVAQVAGMTNTDGWAKAGIMLRDGLGANARHIFVAVNPSGLPGVFWRTLAGGVTDFRSNNYTLTRAWLKLVRSGNAFQAYQSADGMNWVAIGAAITLDLPGTVLAGLAVTSHHDGSLCTASFEQLSFPGSGATSPPPATVNAPTGLAATAVSSSQINLAWADNATNETAYQVERSTNNADFATVATLGANTANYADAGVAAATMYYYRVRATAGSSASDYSNTASAGTGSPTPPPAGTWLHADVGAAGLAGSDDASGVAYTVRGSGSDVWDRTDAFHFLYRSVSGDCVVEARVTSETETNAWAKAGLMIRESLAAGARNAFVFFTPAMGAFSQFRDMTGGTTTSTAGPYGLAIPYWLRLSRTGNIITAACSPDGVTWTTLGTYTTTVASDVLVGFAVTAHDNTKLNTATFEEPFVQ